MVAIMVFEDVGLRASFGRLREVEGLDPQSVAPQQQVTAPGARVEDREGEHAHQVVDEVGAFLQVLRGVAGPDGREIHHRRGYDSTYRQVGGRLSNDLREEILVAETGDAGREHLGHQPAHRRGGLRWRPSS